MIRILFSLTFSFTLFACGGSGGGSGSPQPNVPLGDTGCKPLTGTFRLSFGTEEVKQDGCVQPVKINAKLVLDNGQEKTVEYFLDGVRTEDPGGTVLKTKFSTRSWTENKWVEKWENYEKGKLVSQQTSYFYINSNNDLVYEDDTGQIIIAKRIR